VRRATLAGERTTIVFAAAEKSAITVDLAFTGLRLVQVVASSRSRRRLLDNAVARKSAEPDEQVAWASPGVAGRVTLGGLTGARYRVFVIDAAGLSSPRLVWSREDVPAGASLAVDLDAPDLEGRVDAGETIRLLGPEGAAFTGAGSIEWEVYTEPLVLEGGVAWPGALVLPPVRGVAQITFVPALATAHEAGIVRWTFWTDGAQPDGPRVLRVPAGGTIDRAGAWPRESRLLVDDGDPYPILVRQPGDLIRETADGWRLFGVPRGKPWVLVASGKEPVGSRPARVVRVTNPAPIPRAYYPAHSGGFWSDNVRAIAPGATVPVALPFERFAIVEVIPDLSETFDSADARSIEADADEVVLD
jgi:hypothetical protein